MLVVAVGIPANVAILCTLVTKIRKVSSAILYCSLAVSDLFLLLSLLFKAHYHFHGNNWVLGEAACRVVTACFYGNLYCSAQTLACISIKRYLAVVHPFIRAIGSLRCGASPAMTSCPCSSESHVFLLYYNLFLTVFGLLVPLVVTVVCYGRIVCELNRSHHDWAMYIQASSLVFVIFLLCFTPAGVLHLLHYAQLFVYGTESLYVHFKVAVCLCCLHACLDPFLFLLMSKSVGTRLYFRAFKGKTLSLSV
ncbi:hypothetical protein KUCAC02_008859 [Chaenocephalus aceratus]|uniref:Uncharacterized protein n=1 Tax=Chaenocephalus aceratus TaxID=36190 RepID=A0ACB9WTJ5_CHAAC|nr:hypothetical protein KUCAC02_008859 [Chaenocephalus aceratus]